MSKSRKRQTARKNADAGAPFAPLPAAGFASAPADAPGLDPALYERLVAIVSDIGEEREEGDRLAYVYNGDAISAKYVEGNDDEPASLLVAAFKLGVVLQVRGDQLVRYQPGAWLQQLEHLALSEDEDQDEAPEAGLE